MKSVRPQLFWIILAAASAWALFVEPAHATNGGCCVFSGTCTTTTRAICNRLNGAFNCGVCDGNTNKCVKGTSCFSCAGGTNPDAMCQSSADCSGLCVGQVDCSSGNCRTMDDLATGDIDGDRVFDFQDNCPLVDNADQLDTNGDGFGDPCQPTTAANASDTCTADFVNPLCQLIQVIEGPPKQLKIQVQDTDSGLSNVEILIQDNATVASPPIIEGDTGPVIIIATKTDQTKSARVELRVTDVMGNSITCDPVVTAAVRVTGAPASDSYTNLSESEDTVRIDNGNPGVKNIDMVVNGEQFKIAGLKDGERRIVKITSAMLEGGHNVVTLTSYGKPGGSAAVLIWDGR
jgi:hypothetical protein